MSRGSSTPSVNVQTCLGSLNFQHCWDGLHAAFTLLEDLMGPLSLFTWNLRSVFAKTWIYGATGRRRGLQTAWSNPDCASAGFLVLTSDWRDAWCKASTDIRQWKCTNACWNVTCVVTPFITQWVKVWCPLIISCGRDLSPFYEQRKCEIVWRRRSVSRRLASGVTANLKLQTHSEGWRQLCCFTEFRKTFSKHSRILTEAHLQIFCYHLCISFCTSYRSVGLWRGSSRCSPAAPAGSVTGCTAAGADRNPHRRSGVCGRHTPVRCDYGCATGGREEINFRDQHNNKKESEAWIFFVSWLIIRLHFRGVITVQYLHRTICAKQASALGTPGRFVGCQWPQNGRCYGGADI